MLGKVKNTKIEEFDEVIELINHIFRITRNELPTMKEEFPLLLTENNRNNMKIIKEDNQVVSVVSFMKDKIYIEGIEFNYGAIGGVCTKNEYTKRGLSSLILDEVENSMKQQNVDICLISGTRSLYTRRNAIIAKSFKLYDIEPENMKLDFKIRNYEEKDLISLARLYNQKSTRYNRRFIDFKKIIESATHAWGEFSYAKHVLVREDEIIGYVIIRIINKENSKYGQIVELNGDTLEIYQSLKQLAYELKLDNIEYSVHVKDQLNFLDKYNSYNLDNQEGVIKIINYERFVQKIKLYLNMYLEEKDINNFGFSYDGEYKIKFYDEKIKLSNLKEFTDLIFGSTEIEKIKFEENSRLKKVLKNVFPLPMPWTKNLNYQ